MKVYYSFPVPGFLFSCPLFAQLTHLKPFDSVKTEKRRKDVVEFQTFKDR
jgi:hypothetical protein